LTSTHFETQPAVSIIVPVYNTAAYVERCVESLLNQTLTDIEIVLVDDGSSDDSPLIIDRYARLDHRITVVRHERNEGLHVARISGVLPSHGKFVGYVDSDDCASADMFERLYRTAIDRQADVVRTGAWLRREGDDASAQGGRHVHTLSFTERTYATGIEYLDADFYPSMCLHLHHRRLWQLALPHFPRVRLVGEDNLTSFILAFFAGVVVSLPSVDYVYIERDSSLSGDVSLNNIVRHIHDRAAIVRLLRGFARASGGRAERCLKTLVSNNRGLLRAYVDSLKSHLERASALALFEATWGEDLTLEDSSGETQTGPAVSEP
jgi:glycosyltransferase involved in cell wall biosynthesis